MTIPGRALAVIYQRRPGDRKPHRHDFARASSPVRMRTNADGSVTFRGRSRIWADDREAGFDRYRENPLPEKYRIDAFARGRLGRGKKIREYGYQVRGPYDSPTQLSGTGSFSFPHLQAAKHHAARQFLDPAVHQVVIKTLQDKDVLRLYRRTRRNPMKHHSSGGGSLLTYALLAGGAYLLFVHRPAAAAPSQAAPANPLGGLLQTFLHAVTSGLTLGAGQPVEFWINPATGEFQDVPGGTTTPPGPGFRPASEWEVGQHTVFS